MNAKFSVGETIRLESYDYPQCNGHYLVLEVRDGEGFDHVGNEWIDTIHYKLDDGPGDHYWAECALRKLDDDPGDEFAAFMDKAFGSSITQPDSLEVS